MIFYHRTDIYNAYKKIASQQTWSKDGYSQANFHTEKYGGGSDCKNEITLHFEWNGKIANGEPNEWPGPPNVLFEKMWSGNSEKLWSLFLFPGTNSDLVLTGFSNIEIQEGDDFEHKNHVMKEIEKLLISPIQVAVPHKNQRKNIVVPQLPKNSLFSRLFGASKA